MNRPMPPDALLDPGLNLFAPAPDVVEWIRSTFIDPGAPLENEDHEHLAAAVIGVVWASSPAKANGLDVVGMAEAPMLRGKAWARLRQEAQMEAWFGCIPDFVITLWASYAAEVDDVTWCALVEHELYHCAQKLDDYGFPKFNSATGAPVFEIRGHDVEEFVGIVRRYGVGAAAGRTAELVRAAQKPPEVAMARIAAACGTCRLQVA